MKNKIVYIALFVLLFIVLFGSQCFAALDISVLPQGLQDCINANADGTSADEDFLEANYYLILQDSNYNTYLYFSNTEINCMHSVADNVYDRYYIGTSSGGDALSAIVFSSSDGITFTWGSSGTTNAGTNTYLDATAYRIIQSNFNVYDSSTGELLFQQPPQVGTLAPIVEEVETEKTLEEIVLILPLIIVVVVSFLGLRKALRMLSALLRRS